MIEEIKATLQKYEPRIVVHDIEPTDHEDPFQVTFKMRCKIRDSKHSVLLSFQHHKDLIKMEVDP